MNADPAELQKFSDLAHRWWDPESEFKPLHLLDPRMLTRRATRRAPPPLRPTN